MVRKRVRDADRETLPDAPPITKTSKHAAENEDESDEDVDMVNVDFEFFNMLPDIDFHGLKALLRQLLDCDSQLFDISALIDLVLSQPTIGSTVKVDGEETDPYAFLTCLNIHEHGSKEPMTGLRNYLTTKARAGGMEKTVQLLEDKSAQVGLILAERLINVPTELAPPMYTMVIDEIEAAVEDEEPYSFTHYLLLSKTYLEIASTLDAEDAGPKTKKNKKQGKELFYFHPEDEILKNHAVEVGSYEYTKDEGEGMADSKRAFQDLGIKPQGSLMLIEAAKFQGAAEALVKYVGGGQ